MLGIQLRGKGDSDYLRHAVSEAFWSRWCGCLLSSDDELNLHSVSLRSLEVFEMLNSHPHSSVVNLHTVELLGRRCSSRWAAEDDCRYATAATFRPVGHRDFLDMSNSLPEVVLDHRVLVRFWRITLVRDARDVESHVGRQSLNPVNSLLSLFARQH